MLNIPAQRQLAGNEQKNSQLTSASWDEMLGVRNYLTEQHDFVQLAEHDCAQHGLEQPAGHDSVLEAHELIANAEAANSEAMERHFANFFIVVILFVCQWFSEFSNKLSY